MEMQGVAGSDIQVRRSFNALGAIETLSLLGTAMSFACPRFFGLANFEWSGQLWRKPCLWTMAENAAEVLDMEQRGLNKL